MQPENRSGGCSEDTERDWGDSGRDGSSASSAGAFPVFQFRDEAALSQEVGVETGDEVRPGHL